MYIPSIGLWMLFCWEAHDLAGLWPSGRAALGGLAVGLLAACCVLSSIQLRIWQNEGALLARIPQSNSNARAHADFADFLLHSGQLNQAIAECRTAISIAPAVTEYPVLLGDILLAAGKPDDAIEQFQGALRMDQTAGFARVELGRAFLIKKRLPDAEGEFNAVLRNQPKNFEAQTLLAQCLLIQGKTSNAVTAFWSSLKLQPNQAEALNDLAWVLATDPHPDIRHGTNAVQLAYKACELTRFQEPKLLGTLAAAWAEAGDFDKAVLIGQRAHDVATNLAQHAADPAWAQSLKTLADTNTQLVTLYRQHKPFREKK
jgi:Tfp pilus assembly protein PilF